MSLHATDEGLLCWALMAKKFFDEREDQSEVKARIVSKYFAVWARIIGPQARARGFALSSCMMVLEIVACASMIAGSFAPNGSNTFATYLRHVT
jgi:hypothetical protein